MVVICVLGSVVTLWAANDLAMITLLLQWCATLPAAFAGAAMARTGWVMTVRTLKRPAFNLRHIR